MARPLLAAFLSLLAITPASGWELAVCADPEGAPYSRADASGFDNRIATLLAEELGADVSFVWMRDHRLRTAERHLHGGACDVVMGVLDGQNGFLTSHAYYRTGYVVVAPEAGPAIASLDDPALEGLRIGVPGGARKTTPPALALARRGRLDALAFFGDAAAAGATEAAMVEALSAGSIDVAILWGPMAGFLASGEGGLAVAPVRPEIDIPFLPMFGAFSVGVRPHDEALRDALDRALAARWDDVQAILAEARVPTMPLPRPVVEARLEAGPLASQGAVR